MDKKQYIWRKLLKIYNFNQWIEELYSQYICALTHTHYVWSVSNASSNN